MDTQKRVGDKCNLLYGLVRDIKQVTIRAIGHIIPGYGRYQQLFETCYNFNRALHDRCWPHKRGESGVPDDLGAHQDYIQAAMLENIFNAYFCMPVTFPNSQPFYDICIELDNDLYEESVSLVVDNEYICLF